MSDKQLCNMDVVLDVNKSAPILSQSENAFNSRYHTGKNAVGGGLLKNQKAGGYYLAVGKNRVGGLPEVVPVFDPKVPEYSPKTAGKYPEPLFLNNQKGGAYNFIVNPETGRRVKLNGRIGRKVLKNYLLVQNGGDMSIFDPNLQNRQFGCKQPEWAPNCV